MTTAAVCRSSQQSAPQSSRPWPDSLLPSHPIHASTNRKRCGAPRPHKGFSTIIIQINTHSLTQKATSGRCGHVAARRHGANDVTRRRCMLGRQVLDQSAAEFGIAGARPVKSRCSDVGRRCVDQLLSARGPPISSAQASSCDGEHGQ